MSDIDTIEIFFSNLAQLRRENPMIGTQSYNERTAIGLYVMYKHQAIKGATLRSIADQWNRTTEWARTMESKGRRFMYHKIENRYDSHVLSLLGFLDYLLENKIEGILDYFTFKHFTRTEHTISALRVQVFQLEAQLTKTQQEASRHLSPTVETLDLSVRSMNVLRAEEIETIQDLVNYGAERLLKVPNMGRKSLKEITEALETVHGIDFK